MKVAIIRYNAGNTQSVIYALNRLGIEPVVTDNKEELLACDKIIFPGVGEASTAMHYLKERGLDKLLPTFKQPFLGICLGLQLMCKHSEEYDTPCLGVFDETVKKFIPQGDFKVPHIGWNELVLSDNTWLDPAIGGKHAYFVHSYYAPVNEYTSAVTEYITPFSAAMKKNNFYAAQFHPEKSAETGVLVLESFLRV